MESQFSNALLDVKLQYKFMKKECFEFVEYYRKNQKMYGFSQISKIWLFEKNETFKERTPIGNNFTTKYRQNTCNTALGTPNCELFAEEFLREVKVEI